MRRADASGWQGTYASRSLGWLEQYEMWPAIFNRFTYCEKPVPVPDTRTSLARVQAGDLISYAESLFVESSQHNHTIIYFPKGEMSGHASVSTMTC